MKQYFSLAIVQDSQAYKCTVFFDKKVEKNEAANTFAVFAVKNVPLDQTKPFAISYEEVTEEEYNELNSKLVEQYGPPEGSNVLLTKNDKLN